MLRWLQEFKESKRETKMFIITIAIFMVIVIGFSAYAYLRLGGARSGQQTSQLQWQQVAEKFRTPST